MPAKGVFKINGHDYAPYVKAKTGLGWARENTNDEDAGRDAGDVMGQSRILCKLQNVVQIEQNLCKTGAAQAAAALFIK